jgi:hypothetical protein
MKKTLLLSILGLCAFGADAQITLTSADIATPTKVIYQAQDTMPAVSIGGSGASQTWNMTALNTHTVDTLTFLPYSAAPNPKFSSANIAVKFGWQNSYAYLNNSSSSATILGSSGVVDLGNGPTQIDQVNTPGEILANWPATYLSSFSSTYSTKSKYYFGIDPGFGVVVDSVRTHGRVVKNANYDAWGTITTPLGSYSSLRSKETIVRRDSTDVFIAMLGGWQNNISTSADSSANYTWWSNGIGFPLVEVRMDSVGISNVSWLLSLPMTVGVNEYTSATEVNVYPNPAKDMINFEVDANVASSIQIYDITGRVIETIRITVDRSVINTSGYANGSYTYSILDRSNAILNRGKFNVVK